MQVTDKSIIEWSTHRKFANHTMFCCLLGRGDYRMPGTLSMFGTSSCSFRIRSLIFVLLTWAAMISTSASCCATYLKSKKFYTSRCVFTNPLGNTAWVCGTSPLGTDLAGYSILELEELFNTCHLRRCLRQAELVRKAILHRWHHADPHQFAT